MIRSFLTVSFLILMLQAGFGQKQIVHQQLHWYAYYNTIVFNEKWAVRTDFQERRFLNPDKQHHVLVRSILLRSLGENWQGGPGFCYALQSPQDPNSINRLAIPELRPYIEFLYKQNTKWFTFNHRYNLEARFFHNTSNGELSEGYSFGSFRFRYRLGIDINLYQSRDDKQIIRARVSDEVLVNVGNEILYNSFDHNRLYFAIQYEPQPDLSFELGYLNWFQQRNSGEDYFARDIFRFAINQKIKL